MSVVKINAIEVPEGRGPELEARFAKRAGEVENMPGFESFELLRPVSGDDRYFVYTRWETEEAFQAWVNSKEFVRGHAQAAKDRGEQPVAHGSALLAFEVVLQVARPEGAPASQ
ncbi:MAG: antibiotic biosynthesis monooxygenase [Actinobacteria bacterium]|nr:antibiotic biosynthesis monooxygenase [Actinomycetota bacterium]